MTICRTGSSIIQLAGKPENVAPKQTSTVTANGFGGSFRDVAILHKFYIFTA